MNKKKYSKINKIGIKNGIIVILLVLIVALFAKNFIFSKFESNSITGNIVMIAGVGEIEIDNEQEIELSRFFNGYQKLRALKLLKLIRDNPENSENYKQLGIVYYEITDEFGDDTPNVGAIESFKKATEFDPGDIEAYQGLGWSYLKWGRYDEALIAFGKVNSLKFNKNVGAGAGWAYYAQGNYNKALESFGKAIDARDNVKFLKKGDYHIDIGLGWTYYRQGNFDEAKKYFERSEESVYSKIGMVVLNYELKNPLIAKSILQDVDFGELFLIGTIGSINVDVINCVGEEKEVENVYRCVNHQDKFGIVV